MKHVVLARASKRKAERVEARSYGRPWQRAHELRFSRRALLTEAMHALQRSEVQADRAHPGDAVDVNRMKM
jgi:hypothetical protein